jgi:hypothetical protein
MLRWMPGIASGTKKLAPSVLLFVDIKHAARRKVFNFHKSSLMLMRVNYVDNPEKCDKDLQEPIVAETPKPHARLATDRMTQIAE